MKEEVVRLRQDLSALTAELGHVGREYLYRGSHRGPAEARAIAKQVVSVVPVVDNGVELDLSFLQEAGEVPVCGLEVDGMPVHPPGIYQEGGRVKATRRFGGTNVPRETIGLLSELGELAEESLEEALGKTVYTQGTAAGFENRLREQMTRKCVQATEYFGDSFGKLVSRLELLLPCSGELPDWNGDLWSLLEEVEVTRTASAGAPYWCDKREAQRKLVLGCLPLMVDALENGTLIELSREQPEMFLCEVKNKTDRYDAGKLKDKTRPYINFPYHISVLISFLSQSFTRGLKTAEQEGRNAYGISMSDGRIMGVIEKVRALRELGKKGGEPVYFAYGDDMDLYYKHKGTTYRVSPDFRQMDGSVDRTTVKAVVKMVLRAFEKQHGKSQFWKSVGDLWVDMALDPRFIVNGTQTYRKPQKDGLMTGVVGTTLFDTAKAALAMSAYVEQIHDYREYGLLEERRAKAFFMKLGLEIKEGTWNPEAVNLEPIPDTLFGRNKFLGVRWMWAQGPKRVELVPTLDYEEWLTLVVVPRDDPGEVKRKGGGGGATSELQMNRRLFDRARGLLVTGAVFEPAIEQILGGIVDGLPAVALAMHVSSGGGKGEAPLEAPMLGEAFEWENSRSYPNRRRVEDVYFSPDNKWGAQWTDPLPGLDERIEEVRKPRMAPTLRLDKGRVVAVPKAPPEEPKLPPVGGRGEYTGIDPKGRKASRRLEATTGSEPKGPKPRMWELVERALAKGPLVLEEFSVKMGLNAEDALRVAVDNNVVRMRVGGSLLLSLEAIEGLPLVGESKRRAEIERAVSVVSKKTTRLQQKMKLVLTQPHLARMTTAKVVVQEGDYSVFVKPDDSVQWDSADVAVMLQSVSAHLSHAGYRPLFKSKLMGHEGEGLGRTAVYRIELYAVLITNDYLRTDPRRTEAPPRLLITADAATSKLAKEAVAYGFAKALEAAGELRRGESWVEATERAERLEVGAQELNIEVTTQQDGSEENETTPTEDAPSGDDDSGHGPQGNSGVAEEEEEDSDEAPGGAFDPPDGRGAQNQEEGAPGVHCYSSPSEGGGQFIRSGPRDVPVVGERGEIVREGEVAPGESVLEAGCGDHSWRASDPRDEVGRREEPRDTRGGRSADPQPNGGSVGGWRAQTAYPSTVPSYDPRMVHYWGQRVGWGPWVPGGGGIRSGYHGAWGGVGGLHSNPSRHQGGGVGVRHPLAGESGRHTYPYDVFSGDQVHLRGRVVAESVRGECNQGDVHHKVENPRGHSNGARLRARGEPDSVRRRSGQREADARSIPGGEDHEPNRQSENAVHNNRPRGVQSVESRVDRSGTNSTGDGSDVRRVEPPGAAPLLQQVAAGRQGNGLYCRGRPYCQSSDRCRCMGVGHAVTGGRGLERRRVVPVDVGGGDRNRGNRLPRDGAGHDMAPRRATPVAAGSGSGRMEERVFALLERFEERLAGLERRGRP